MIESSKIPDQYSGTAVRVLCLLWEAERAGVEITGTELARNSGVKPAAMTQLLDTLEAREMTWRRRSAHDRREKLVGLTHRGVALMKEMARPVVVPAGECPTV